MTPFHTTLKTKRFYNVNRELVLGLRLTGCGHSAAKRVLSVLNLPSPVNKDLSTKHAKALEQIANYLLEKELKKGVIDVKRFLQGENEDMTIADTSEEQLADLVLDAGVPIVDRGTSKDGLLVMVLLQSFQLTQEKFWMLLSCRFHVRLANK